AAQLVRAALFPDALARALGQAARFLPARFLRRRGPDGWFRRLALAGGGRGVEPKRLAHCLGDLEHGFNRMDCRLGAMAQSDQPSTRLVVDRAGRVPTRRRELAGAAGSWAGARLRASAGGAVDSRPRDSAQPARVAPHLSRLPGVFATVPRRAVVAA